MLKRTIPVLVWIASLPLAGCADLATGLDDEEASILSSAPSVPRLLEPMGAAHQAERSFLRVPGRRHPRTGFRHSFLTGPTRNPPRGLPDMRSGLCTEAPNTPWLTGKSVNRS